MKVETIQLARKFGLEIGNEPRIPLDYAVIPDALNELIPFAELLILDDQAIREDWLARVPLGFLQELEHKVVTLDKDGSLTDWLGQEDWYKEGTADHISDTIYCLSLLRDYSETYPLYRK